MAEELRTSFIVGSPRSGSTWVQTMLSAIPGMTCIESRAYGSFFDVWPEPDGGSRPRMTIDRFVEMLSTYVNLEGIGVRDQRHFIDVGTRVVVDAVHRTVRSMSGTTHLVEKVTPYVHTSGVVLRSIARDFPETAVVQLLRDGRDVATSGVFHWLKRSDKSSDRYRFFVDRSIGRLTRFFDDESLRLWCQQWRGPIDAFRRLRPAAPVLRYEELQADAPAALTALLVNLGHEASPEHVLHALDQASFERMSGGRRPGDAAPTEHVRRGVVGDWQKHFTRRDGEMFIDATGDLLITLGYEPDHSWLDDLPETLGADAPGHDEGAGSRFRAESSPVPRRSGDVPIPIPRAAGGMRQPDRIVLVTGVGRSGTTALRNSLGRHPGIHSNGFENNIVQDVLAAAQRNIRLPSRRHALVVPETDYYRRFRDLLLSVLWPDYPRDRAPMALAAVNLNANLVETALQVFPGARMVCLVRNGISVVSSRLRYQAFAKQDFADHCDVWNRSVAMMAWAEENPAFGTVFRQEWVADADLLHQRMGGVWAFLDLPSDDAPVEHLLSTRYHPTDGDTDSGSVHDWRALEAERAARWSSWTAEQRAIFIDRCGDSMARAGYEIPFI